MVPTKAQAMDLFVIRSSNPISWLIRFLTRSRWSHTGVFYSHSTIATTSDHIVGDGFEFVKSDKYFKKRKWAVYRHSKMTHLKQQQGREILESMLNQDYDYRGLFSMLWSQLRGRDSYDDGTKEMKCSEGVAWLYREIGLRLLKHTKKKPGALAPGDLLNDSNWQLVETNDPELNKLF